MTVRKSDRAFHISVAAASLLLGVLAVGTIVAVKDPLLLSKLRGVHPVDWFNAQLGLVNTSGQSTVPVVRKPQKPTTETVVTPQSGDDTGAVPIQNQNMVKVELSGLHVTAANIHTVKQLLNGYNLVELVSTALHLNLHKPVNIYLVGNQADYAAQLSSLGVSSDEIKTMAMDTGGFTQGSTIMIPLYQNRYPYDLANTLAHELTHAFLNQNVDNLPSWINEGLAVSNGMAAQSQVQNPVAFSGYTRQMAESILAATVSGTLIPLSEDEGKILQKDIPYDLELQDWLAVRELVTTKGRTSFENYFHDINSGIGTPSAFNQAFGLSESAFNQQLTKMFMVFEEQEDNGAMIQFNFPSDYQGNVQLLQHGIQTWYGFVPNKGLNSIQILPSGMIETNASKTVPDYDSTPADENTLYVNLDPNHPFSYQGQTVTDSGFAFDYHDDMYGFVNSWITLKDGHTIYLNTPDLFNIRVVSAKETKVDKHLLDLIDPTGAAS